MSLTFFDEIAPTIVANEMGHGDYPGTMAVVSAQPNVVRIDALWCLNTDSVSNVVTLLVGVVEFASIAVPARAGMDGNPPADLLANLSALSGWQGLVVPSNIECDMRLSSAPTIGTKIVVVGTGGLIPTLVGL